ncbi:MAG: hypothetical protein LBM87_00455 [Ruminococcus sp.]|nr:hypothetical protein [Ruminococcus sp.]
MTAKIEFNVDADRKAAFKASCRKLNMTMSQVLDMCVGNIIQDIAVLSDEHNPEYKDLFDTSEWVLDAMNSQNPDDWIPMSDEYAEQLNYFKRA